MKKRLKVYSFYPVIYPRWLFVVVLDKDFGRVNEEFYEYKTHNGLGVSGFEDGDVGTWYTVVHKRTHRKGSLIAIRPDSDGDDIGHECLHAIGGILNDVDVHYDINNLEPFTYMQGWAIKCTELAINKEKRRAKDEKRSIK